MSNLLDTPLGERFTELCGRGLIPGEAQGHIELLLEGGKVLAAKAQTQIEEWVRIGEALAPA